MEWERGETPPGRVMSNLKTGGLRDVLEGLVAKGPVAAAQPAPGGAAEPPGAAEPSGAAEDDAPSPENWTPVV